MTLKGARAPMDDVAALIAAKVVNDVDGVLWDWDDVAAAAATLATCSGTFQSAISGALWREVGTAMSRKQHHSPLAVTCVGARKEDLLDLARCARVDGVHSKTRVDALRAKLEACEAHVGPSCPISVRAALGIVDLKWRWINSSTAERSYGLPFGLMASVCRKAGAQYHGTRFLLCDVRNVARYAFDAGGYPNRALLKTRDRLLKIAEQMAQYDAKCEARLRRKRGIADALTAAGLPAELVMCTECSDFLSGQTDDTAVPELVESLRACIEEVRAEGLEWPTDVHISVMQTARNLRLCRALEERGLKLRNDSRTCWNFIRSGTGSIVELVEIADEMRFFFENTEYNAIMTDKRRFHRRYFGGYSSDEDDDEPFNSVAASRDAKKQALRRLGAVPSDAPVNVLRMWEDLALEQT